MNTRERRNRARGWGCSVVLSLTLVAAVCAETDLLQDWPRNRNRHAAAIERAITGSDTITVVSLVPFPELDANGSFVKPPEDQRVDAWRIHGSAVVTNGADIATLASALAAGMRENNGDAALCFNPRHAIRLDDGRDIVICLECWQFRVQDGSDTTYYLTSHTPEAIFDDVFGRYGVSRWKPAAQDPVE